MKFEQSFLVLCNLILLVLLYSVLSRPVISRMEMAWARLAYYAYWYFLLFVDASKMVVGILIFGYAIMNIFIAHNTEDMYTFVRGYRLGWHNASKVKHGIYPVVNISNQYSKQSYQQRDDGNRKSSKINPVIIKH